MSTTMWDSIKRGLQDGAAVAFDRAEALTLVGRARLDVAAAKTRVTRLEGKLGVETFRLLEEGAPVAEAEQVCLLRDEIRQARAELADAERSYGQVRDDVDDDGARTEDGSLGT